MRHLLNRGIAAVFALTVLAAAGCSSLAVPNPPAAGTTAEAASPPREGWWNVRFKIYWPDTSQKPSWYVDALLADRVVSPVLERHRRHLALWRFHRRAAGDDSGHQFSLIFYGTPSTARKIYKEIEANPLLEEMKTRGLIVRVACDDTDNIRRPGLEGQSDRHWSPVLQKSWPYFIMGVSEMWLDLVHRIADEENLSTEPETMEEIQERYRKINARVDELWGKEGGHAFLHHLNAVFGYEPVTVWGKYLFSF